MEQNLAPYWVYGVKTAIVALFLFAILRLLGKRSAAQMNIYDLATIMAVSNAVQNAMTGGRGDLPVGLTASTSLILLAWIWTRLVIRRPQLERQVLGQPSVILNHGVLLKERMARDGITEDEVMEALRQHGLSEPSQAMLGVFEIDGSISIIPRSTGNRTGKKTKRAKPSRNEAPGGRKPGP